MKYYLVTGVAGFIGWKVAEYLLKDGKAVLGVDNINDAYDIKLKEWRLNELRKLENFKFHKIDLADFQATKLLFEIYPVSAVIHLAARAGVRKSLENPWIYVESNITSTLNLLELMKEFGIRKMVLASTSSVYAGQKPPFHENLKVDNPLSPYAATKKSAELLAYTYHHLYELDISVVRYFTVYGPAGRPDMSIFRFIKWIYEKTESLLFISSKTLSFKEKIFISLPKRMPYSLDLSLKYWFISILSFIFKVFF